MFESKCLFTFCVLLLIYSTSAKNVCTELDGTPCAPGSANYKVHEAMKAVPLAALKDLDRIHIHVLRASDSEDALVLHHTNITGIPDCSVEDFEMGNRDGTINFAVHCPHIQVRFKSQDCLYEVNSEGVGKCQFCYNDYVMKIQAILVTGFTDSLVQYFNVSSSSYTYEKNKDTENKCANEIVDGLTTEKRIKLSEEFQNAVFSTSSSEIVKSYNNRLYHVNLFAMYHELRQEEKRQESMKN